MSRSGRVPEVRTSCQKWPSRRPEAVARGPSSLLAQLDRAVAGRRDHPGERDVEIDVGPAVGGDAPRHVAPIRRKLLKPRSRGCRGAVRTATWRAARQVAEEAVRWRVRGPRVDERAPWSSASSSIGRCRVGSCWPSSSSVATQSAAVLAIPARVAGCWPKLRESQRSRRKGWCSASGEHHRGGGVLGAVVHEQHLGHAKARPRSGRGRSGERSRPAGPPACVPPGTRARRSPGRARPKGRRSRETCRPSTKVTRRTRALDLPGEPGGAKRVHFRGSMTSFRLVLLTVGLWRWPGFPATSLVGALKAKALLRFDPTAAAASAILGMASWTVFFGRLTAAGAPAPQIAHLLFAGHLGALAVCWSRGTLRALWPVGSRPGLARPARRRLGCRFGSRSPSRDPDGRVCHVQRRLSLRGLQRVAAAKLPGARQRG